MIFKEYLEKNDVKTYLHLSIYITKYSDITDMHSFPQTRIYTHHLPTTNHPTDPPSSSTAPKTHMAETLATTNPLPSTPTRDTPINQPTNQPPQSINKPSKPPAATNTTQPAHPPNSTSANSPRPTSPKYLRWPSRLALNLPLSFCE